MAKSIWKSRAVKVEETLGEFLVKEPVCPECGTKLYITLILPTITGSNIYQLHFKCEKNHNWKVPVAFIYDSFWLVKTNG